jgi:hypothetical protein
VNPLPAAAALMMLLAAPPAAPPAAPQPTAPDWESASGLMAQHVVIHVPQVTFTSRTTIITRSMPMPAPPPPPVYVERKSKDCIKSNKIVGAVLNRTDSVDLVLSDGSRMRAKLGSDCPALGFYGGFYVKPNPDGKMCAGRDSIRSRMGATCGIQELRTLQAR